MYTATLDELEIEHGTAILSELTGQHLTRNQQPVRLFDQTRKSAEFYFRSDKFGKPYIQDFQNGKRHYPVSAYSEVYQLDFNVATSSLIQQYYGEFPRVSTPRPTHRTILPQPARIDYLPNDYYQQCRTRFERNGLYEYLRFTYGHQSADEVFTRYRLGTSRHWQYLGYLATCLPQFDLAGNLRQVKIMAFDAMNGRRVKNDQPAQVWSRSSHHYEPTAPGSAKTMFAGKQIAKDAGLNDVHPQQCFFGEHLLSEYPGQSVAIVEGESTAIECSIHWPQFVWLATGGSTGGSWHSPERFGVLRSRNAVLWPDTGKYTDWSNKADLLRPMVKTLNVTDYVEKNAPPGVGNVDLRDLLTRPCYFPTGENKTIYGDVLTVEPGNTYPPEWDTTAPALSLTTSTNRPLVEVLARCLNRPADAVPLYQLSLP